MYILNFLRDFGYFVLNFPDFEDYFHALRLFLSTGREIGRTACTQIFHKIPD